MLFDFSDYQQDQVLEASQVFKDYMKEELLKTPAASLPPTEVRCAEVEELTEFFYQHFDRQLDSVCLYYLTNYVLLDYIKSFTKSKYDEDSFLSPRQIATRYKKEFSCQSELLEVYHNRKLFNLARPKRRVNIDDV